VVPMRNERTKPSRDASGIIPFPALRQGRKISRQWDVIAVAITLAGLSWGWWLVAAAPVWWWQLILAVNWAGLWGAIFDAYWNRGRRYREAATSDGKIPAKGERRR